MKMNDFHQSKKWTRYVMKLPNNFVSSDSEYFYKLLK